mgnify:CR=1 FL=1
MKYVTAVVTQFTKKNVPELKIISRGKFISKAVDITEVSTKKFLKDIKVTNIKIDSEEFKNKEGKTISVSTMEILLKKDLLYS